MLIALLLSWLCISQLDAQIRAYPYLEDFEQFGRCTPDCRVSCPLVNFWENAANDDFDWVVQNGSTPSSNTGPSSDAIPGTSSGNYLYIEPDGICAGGGKEAWLLSPDFEFSSLRNPVLNFSYHAYGEAGARIHLDMAINGVWQQDIIEPIRGSVDKWLQHHIPLDAAANKRSVRFRWRGVSGLVETGDFAIDAVGIREGFGHDISPHSLDKAAIACINASDSARVFIQNLGSNRASSFDIQYSWDNQVWSSIQTINNTIAPGQQIAISIPVGNLSTGSHSLHFVARSSPNLDQDSRNDTLYAFFEASPVVKEIPYLATFEVGPMGWTSSGTRNDWQHGNPRGTVLDKTLDGNFCWGTNLNGTYDFFTLSYLYTPCFDFTQANADPILSFDAKFDLERQDFCWLEYSVDGGEWAKLGTRQSGLTNWYTHFKQAWTGTTNWQNAAHRLVGMQGHVVKFRFVVFSDGTRNFEGMLLDRFMIRYDYDLVIEDIFPKDVCDQSLGTQEQVSVAVHNQGYFDIDNFDMRYKADNQFFSAYKNFQGTITSGNTRLFSFVQTADLSTPGIHWLEAEADFSPDPIRSNNSLRSRAGNFSSPVIELGNDTSVCAGQRLVLKTGVQGGTYRWNTGHVLPDLYVFKKGMYEVFVTDSFGCEGSDKIEVEIPPAIDVLVDVVKPISCPGGDGRLWATATGGVGPLQYRWPNGNTSQLADPTPGGNYVVEVTDSIGCSMSKAKLLPEPDSIRIHIDQLNPVSCPRDSNGAIEITVTGGTPPYRYVWDNGSTNSTISQLKPGLYNVEVTDDNGCFDDMNLVEVPISKDTIPKAILDYQISGGTVSFSSIKSLNASNYVWAYGDGTNESGNPTPDYTYKANGVYFVTLIAQNACGADTTTLPIEIIAVSIDDEENIIAVDLAPNPITEGRFFIKNPQEMLRDVQLSLFDLHGKRLRTWTREMLPTGSRTGFELDALPEGVYLIQMKAEGLRRNWKVVVR
ncbi:MAG: PKD domain-containing protein [Bacteroidia bacterium]